MTDIVATGPAGRGAAGVSRDCAAAPRPPGRSGRFADRRLDSACAQMESLFLQHLLQKMRATVEKTDLFGGGRAEELYTAMLDAEIAAGLSRAGGIGLARVLQHQLEAAGAPGDGPGKKD